MKKFIKNHKNCNMVCTFLLAFASMVAYQGSFFLYGEPKTPKSLLK